MLVMIRQAGPDKTTGTTRVRGATRAAHVFHVRMCGGETRAKIVVVVVVSVVVVVMLLRVPSAVRYRYTPQMRIGVRGDGPSKHLDLVGFRLHDQVHLLSFAIPN